MYKGYTSYILMRHYDDDHEELYHMNTFLQKKGQEKNGLGLVLMVQKNQLIIYYI